jgi:8-oxo-dGTP diphosphatase
VVWGAVVFRPADDWSYTTFVVAVPSEFGASINFETDAVTWDSPDEVEQRPLHAGFAAAWPAIREIIETNVLAEYI